MKRFFYGTLLIVLLFSATESLFAQAPGTLDSTLSYFRAFNDFTSMSDVDDQGRIIVVGKFTKYKTLSRNYIVRIFENGEIDNSFNTGGLGTDKPIEHVKLQSDRKILIGGSFTSYNNIPINGLARLKEDGSLDPTFKTPAYQSYTHKIHHFSEDRFMLVASNILAEDSLSEHLRIFDKDGNYIESFNPFPQGATNTSITASHVQPLTNKILLVIHYSTDKVSSQKQIVRLNENGTLDNTFNSNVKSWDGIIRELETDIDGSILIGGNFKYFNGSFTYTPDFARLNSSGILDNSFRPYINYGNHNGIFQYKVKAGTNGRVLISYGYSNPCCPNIDNDWGYIYSLNHDGSKDSSFQVIKVSYGRIYNFNLKNNKIYIHGDFKSCSSTSKSCFSICNTDGSDFKEFYSPLGVPHQSERVEKIKVLPDGKILLSGFSAFSNGPSGLVRILPSGTVDSSFSNYKNGSVSDFAIQPDGRILITKGRQILRINYDGSLDATFSVQVSTDPELFPVIVKPNSDGTILGIWSSKNGAGYSKIYRLLRDGSIDPSFNADNNTYSVISDFNTQSDGKILLYGSITSENNQSARGIIKLNSDGSIDKFFQTGSGANASVRKSLLYSNGKILLVGDFTKFNEVNAGGIILLNPDGSVDTTFNSSGVSGAIYDVIEQGKNHLIIVGNFLFKGGKQLRNIAMIDTLGNLIYPDLNLPQMSSAYSIFLCAAKYDDSRFIIGGGTITLTNGLLIDGFMRCYSGVKPRYNKIRGKVFSDLNNDCIKQPSDSPIQGMIIKASPLNYFASSDNKGDYTMLIDTSVRNIQLSKIYNPVQQFLFESQCNPSYSVNIPLGFVDSSGFDFSDKIKKCPLLSVEIASTARRRCFKGKSSVLFCNYGNAEAKNVIVKVEFQDNVFPISSTPSWSYKEGNTLVWKINNLNASTCEKIEIIDSVACSNLSEIGGTICTKAHIYPKNTCLPENPLWDKSNIEVKGNCINGVSNFKIINTGNGDMSDLSEYRIYLNDTLISSDHFKLQSGTSIDLNVNSSGGTVRLEADQLPQHPLKSKPRISIEACGTGREINGTANSVPQDDEDFETATSCLNILNSYDPNDKVAQPIGVGVNRYIKNTDKIDYTIRFQNTGNDKAYKVVIVDTLDANLDISTYLQGASSHNYSLQVSGKERPVLTYTFENIMLPDSTTNSVESNGFVSFSIYPLKTSTPGTTIKNNAAIYFDFNPPVITNTVIHNVSEFTATDFTKSDLVEQVVTEVNALNSGASTFHIYPNPFTERLILKGSAGQTYYLNLFNGQGGEVASYKISTDNYLIDVSDLKEGLYIYKIQNDKGPIQTGKLIKK